MTVVAYPHIQPQGPGPWIEVEQRSATEVFRSPTVGTVRTLDRVGSVWAFTVRYQGLTIANARRLEAFLAACRGHGNRFYLPVWTHDQRGSGFGSELITNGTFSSGTTGWTGSGMTLSAPDYVLRGVATQNPAVNVVASQGFSGATQYLPLAGRSILHAPSTLDGISIGLYLDDGTQSVSDYSTSDRGLRAARLTPIATTGTVVPLVLNTGAFAAGVFVDCSFASLARCALVDNGPNLLLQSETLATTWVKTNLTAPSSNDTDVSPDGQISAETLTDDGTNGAHYLSQGVTVSSAAHDVTFSVSLKASSLSWAWIQLTESTGPSDVYSYFNLSTGALGSSATGASWSNLRRHVVSQGNGWYRVTITARKTNAATSLSCLIGTAIGDASGTYAGSGQSIAAWGASCAASSVPVRYRSTTTTADSDGVSQTGAALHLKGLPVSTSGIYRSGDWLQIMQPNASQIVRLTSALNSDAAGLGYLQFEPQLRESPADNAPVIGVNPLARCLLDHNSVRSSRLADNCIDIEFTAIEDIVPV